MDFLRVDMNQANYGGAKIRAKILCTKPLFRAKVGLGKNRMKGHF